MEKLVPLVILIPDKMGQTALDLALKFQRPQVFELMIDMLKPLSEYSCISRHMLKSFPIMVEKSSVMIS